MKTRKLWVKKLFPILMALSLIGGWALISLSHAWQPTTGAASAPPRATRAASPLTARRSITGTVYLPIVMKNYYPPGEIAINEVLYYADAGAVVSDYPYGAWVELYNSGTEPGHLGGWTITGRDGITVATLPDLELPPDDYLTIYFYDGTNDFDFSDGEGSLYVTDAITMPFVLQGDAIALYASHPITATLIDFVAYCSGGELTPTTVECEECFSGAAAYQQAVSRNLWPDGEYVDTIDLKAGESFGRRLNGFDHDVPHDWMIYDWTIYQLPVPSQPENPIQISPTNALFFEDESITLTWEECGPSILSYQLQVDSTSAFTATLVDTTTTAVSYTLPVTDGLYFWRVRATDDQGQTSPWSAVWSFGIGDIMADGVFVGGGGVAVSSDEVGMMGTVVHQYQRKDTDMICLYDCTNGWGRRGCQEGGAHPWNAPHNVNSPAQVRACPHCANYCVRASVQMINHFYGGNLYQDYISYHIFEGVKPPGPRHAGDPEGDLGHGKGVGLSAEKEVLSWALNGASITYKVNPSFSDIKGWIDENRPIESGRYWRGGGGHASVIYGYRCFPPCNTGRAYVHDPTLGSLLVDYNVYATNNVVASDALVPPAIATGRTYNAVGQFVGDDDEDWDDLCNFDEDNRLDSKKNDYHSDDDDVTDYTEVWGYTFSRGDFTPYWIGHPDIDGDGKRAEGDCDTDNGGAFDGGEDRNGDGRIDAGETNPYNWHRVPLPNDDEVWIDTDKNIYAVGETVKIRGQYFNFNKSYPYYIGPDCPDLNDGEPIGHTGNVHTDGDGVIPAWTSVGTCPSAGEHYVIVDVLRDGRYSEPDNTDPLACFTCVEPTIPEKVGTPDTVAPGDTIDYTIVLPANPELEVPAEAWIQDPLPEMLQFIEGSLSCTSGDCQYNEGDHTVTWAGELSPQELVILRFDVTVPEEVPPPYPPTIINRAETFDGVAVCEVSATTTLIVPVHDAALTWDPITPAAGAIVTFVGSASGTEPITFTWDFGDEETGEGNPVTHTYETPADYTVTMTATNAWGQEVVSNEVTVTGAMFDLSITKSDSPDPVYPGGLLTYTIIVTNTGEITATEVVITENYPEGTLFLEAVPSPADGYSIWYFETLPPGASITIMIWMWVDETVSPGTVLTNIVIVDSDETDPVTTMEETLVMEGEGSFSMLTLARRISLANLFEEY